MVGVEQQILIEPMRVAHVEPALALCRAAGWNQLQADWLRLIEYEPMGCFVATIRGQMTGTITTTRYGTSLGWIGMMLVDPQYRRRGIATTLMQHGISYLQNQNVGCIKLDATPEGQKVYERLGFQVELSFQRWQRASHSPVVPEDTRTVAQLPQTHFDSDIAAFGADRSELLRRICNDSIVHVGASSFGMIRAGYLADYLGPITSGSPLESEAMILALCQQTDRTIFWDFANDNCEAIRIAKQLGFEPVRDLVRMWLGQDCRSANYAEQYAFADPSTG